MNLLLWALQGFAALMYGASGVMKLFMFDKISADVRSFDALPKPVWGALGLLELVCTAGLILPGALHWQPSLTVFAAAILAVESLVFIGVHLKCRELPPLLMSAALGLLMAFVAYARWAMLPLA